MNLHAYLITNDKIAIYVPGRKKIFFFNLRVDGSMTARVWYLSGGRHEWDARASHECRPPDKYQTSAVILPYNEEVENKYFFKYGYIYNFITLHGGTTTKFYEISRRSSAKKNIFYRSVATATYLLHSRLFKYFSIDCIIRWKITPS